MAVLIYFILKYPSYYYLYYIQVCNNPKTLLVPNDVKSSAFKNGLLSVVQRKQHPKSYFWWSIGH